MYCSECGFELPESASFCSNCGSPTINTSDNVPKDFDWQTESSGIQADVDILVASALDDSVTKERLSEKSAVVADRLKENPIINYLVENEEPHFIFVGPSTGFRIVSPFEKQISPDTNYYSFLVLTNKRILVLVGTDQGDKKIAIPYNEIKNIDFETGITKIKLTIVTTSAIAEFHAGKEDKLDEDSAIDYIRSKIPSNPEDVASPTDPIFAELGEEAKQTTTDQPKASENGSFLTRLPGFNNENTRRRNILVGVGYVLGGWITLGTIGAKLFPEDNGTEPSNDGDESEPLILASPEDVIVDIDDLGAGWIKRDEEKGKREFFNTDESTHVIIEIVDFEELTGTEEEFESRKSELTNNGQRGYDDIDFGDEGILVKPHDRIANILYRDRNFIVEIRGTIDQFTWEIDADELAEEFAEKIQNNIDSI